MFFLIVLCVIPQSFADCNVTALRTEIQQNCKGVTARPCPTPCVSSLGTNCPHPDSKLASTLNSFAFCKPQPKCKLMLTKKDCMGNCQWCNNKCQAGKAKCQATCIDDPSGELASFGYTCQSLLQAMSNNCGYDMSGLAPSLQGVTPGKLCPKSCSQCATTASSPAPPTTISTVATNSGSAGSDCKDDPAGLVASQGFDCNLVLQVANNNCDFDLSTVSPQVPQGITPGQLCPKSCNRCVAQKDPTSPTSPASPTSPTPVVSSSTCRDDPSGMVTRSGFTCTSVLSITGNDCSRDLSTLSSGIPKGVTPGQLCPKSCALCKDANGKTAPVPQKSTETYINGHVITSSEKDWLQGLGVSFPPGRYFIKADGSAGPEGGPTLMNVYAMAGQSLGNTIDQAMDNSGFTRGVDQVQSTAGVIGTQTQNGFNSAVSWTQTAGQTSVNKLTDAWNQVANFFG